MPRAEFDGPFRGRGPRRRRSILWVICHAAVVAAAWPSPIAHQRPIRSMAKVLDFAHDDVSIDLNRSVAIWRVRTKVFWSSVRKPMPLRSDSIHTSTRIGSQRHALPEVCVIIEERPRALTHTGRARGTKRNHSLMLAVTLPCMPSTAQGCQERMDAARSAHARRKVSDLPGTAPASCCSAARFGAGSCTECASSSTLACSHGNSCTECGARCAR